MALEYFGDLLALMVPEALVALVSLVAQVALVAIIARKRPFWFKIFHLPSGTF